MKIKPIKTEYEIVLEDQILSSLVHFQKRLMPLFPKDQRVRQWELYLQQVRPQVELLMALRGKAQAHLDSFVA